jgi:putative membrane protein
VSPEPGGEARPDTRRPRSVYGVGGEPDARFSMANERTALAWVRTALALDAAGLGVVRFAPPLGGAAGRAAIGGVLVLLGAVTAWSGYRRFLATDRAMRAGAPIPAHAAPRILAAALALVSVVVLVLLAADQLN